MILSYLLSALTLFTLPTLAADPSLHTAEIFIWPPSAAKPSPYLRISYSAPDRATITKQHPIPTIPKSDEFVRLGLHRPDLLQSGLASSADDAWSGISIPRAALGDETDKTVRLLLDGKGEAWHVGFDSVPMTCDLDGPGGKKKEKAAVMKDRVGPRTEVKLVERRPGPKPVLNKPVVLGRDGKVEGAEAPQSFLQKYWWAIALFLVLQLVIGGGGKD